MRTNLRSPVLAFLFPALLVACGGGTANTGGSGGAGGAGGATSSSSSTGGVVDAGVDAPDPLGPWAFEPVTVADLPAVWGAEVAQASNKVAYLAGGVAGKVGPVAAQVVKVEQGPSGAVATVISTAITPRFCGCALVDEGRHELLLIGGRNGSFTEITTAEIVDLATGTVSSFDAGEAGTHPVGCHAVFLPDRDEGYVFGGAAQASGFTAQTWRYHPADHSLTLLDGAGPPGRYDGVFRYPFAGGSVWLTNGMGLSGSSAKFYGDVWKLDPAAGTWSEVAVTGTVPPGRRMPWVAWSGDQGSMVMGFGSNSPQGTTMMGDLWKLDLLAGTWSELPRTMDVQPADRGFAMWLPGPAGSAGLLSGGLEEKGAAKQALVIQPPVTDGDYR